MDSATKAPGYYVVDDAMPEPFVASAWEWIAQNHRGMTPAVFTRGIDRDHGEHLIYRCADHGPLNDKLLEELPAAVEASGVESFEVQYIECYLTMYHHGMFLQWHIDEVYSPDGDIRLGAHPEGAVGKDRNLAFSFHMHTHPKMFTGGDLCFRSGEIVGVKHNRLVMFDGTKQHLVSRVHCDSSDIWHGRWALFGWLWD